MPEFADLVPAPTGRFDGIARPYSADDVRKLRGSLPIEHSLARHGVAREMTRRPSPIELGVKGASPREEVVVGDACVYEGDEAGHRRGAGRSRAIS